MKFYRHKVGNERPSRIIYSRGCPGTWTSADAVPWLEETRRSVSSKKSIPALTISTLYLSFGAGHRSRDTIIPPQRPLEEPCRQDRLQGGP